MDKEVLQDLYDRAKSQGYSKSIEEFEKLIGSDQEVLDDNFEYVKSKGYGKDISEFSTLVGFGEKKNPIVTPSDGEEVLTESTTETEVQDGASDSLEVNKVVEEGVINKSELNFEDQSAPIIEEEVFIPDAPNREGVLDNIELLNSVGYIEANEGVKSMISTEGLTDFDKERLESREKTYRLKNNETGEFEYKKESQIKPDVLKAIKIYETSKDGSYKKITQTFR